MKRTIVPAILALSLIPTSAISRDGASNPEKLRARLESNLRRVTSAIADRAQGSTVGLIADSPAAEGDDEKQAAVDPYALFLQALLRESVLAVRLDDDRKLETRDEDGEISGAAILSGENRAHLLGERKLKYLALTGVKTRRTFVSIQIEVFDLTRMARVLRTSVPLFKHDEEEAFVGWGILPPANVSVLAFAAEKLGEKVDSGECWDLPARPLHDNGYRVHDYDFGTEVPWEETLPGDVVTIDNGKDRHVMVLLEPGETVRQAKILHQNWNNQRFVIRAPLPAHYPPEDLSFWRPGAK